MIVGRRIFMVWRDIAWLLAGVRQVFGGGLCTYADAEAFFSYRREWSVRTHGDFRISRRSLK